MNQSHGSDHTRPEEKRKREKEKKEKNRKKSKRKKGKKRKREREKKKKRKKRKGGWMEGWGVSNGRTDRLVPHGNSGIEDLEV